MADNDFSQQLHDIKGITDVRALAKEVPCSLLLPYLSDGDIRTARNAAWVLTHKPISQILALPHDQLINLAMTIPDTPGGPDIRVTSALKADLTAFSCSSFSGSTSNTSFSNGLLSLNRLLMNFHNMES